MKGNKLQARFHAAHALLSAVLLFSVSGCMSVPDPASVPPELGVAELSQKGQQAFDKNNFKAAEVYYQLIINRFGTDAAALTSAEYEIAHLRMKKENWADAKIRLEAIIARYDVAGETGLPPEYLVLAKNDLARIPVKKAPEPIAAPVKAASPALTDAPAAPAN